VGVDNANVMIGDHNSLKIRIQGRRRRNMIIAHCILQPQPL